jgi:uncharacterized protein
VSGDLVVKVADLLRRPGSQRPLKIECPVAGLALTSAAVPDEAHVELDVVLESLAEAITATGTVLAPWTGECRRCLRPVAGVAEAPVREVFEAHPIEGETYPLGRDGLDLEPMVRELLLLALPLAPLCADDCAGPDPDEHPVSVPDDRSGADDGSPRDPRWAALDDLKLD